MLCLASSRKLGGRCIAGIDRSDSTWIRPVNDSEDGTLTLTAWPSVGEVWDVPIAAPRPEPWQPENRVIDTSETWFQTETLAPKQLLTVMKKAADGAVPLLGSTGSSIPESRCQQEPLSRSLQLFEPATTTWRVDTNWSGRRQHRARFEIGGTQHDLPITDIEWEARMRRLCEELGDYNNKALEIQSGSRVFLTISLGEPYNGSCYKLIAAVIVV